MTTTTLLISTALRYWAAEWMALAADAVRGDICPGCRILSQKLAREKNLSSAAEVPASAGERALDAIAALCGCSEWEYPGQVVRDVKNALTFRDTELDRRDAEILRLRADHTPWDGTITQGNDGI